MGDCGSLRENTREARVRESPHKSAGSGPFKRAVNGREMRNATFLYLLIR